MYDNNKAIGSFAFISGVVLGAAVGAAVAILYAPQSGEETRKDIMKKGKDFADKKKAELEKVKQQKIDPFIEEAKEEFAKAAEKGSVLKKSRTKTSTKTAKK